MKVHKESVNLRLNPELKARLRDIAEEHERTLTEIVDVMLRAALAAYDEAQNESAPADGPGSPGPIRPVA